MCIVITSQVFVNPFQIFIVIKKQEELEEERKQAEAKKQRAEEKKRRKEEFEKLQALKKVQEDIEDEQEEGSNKHYKIKLHYPVNPQRTAMKMLYLLLKRLLEDRVSIYVLQIIYFEHCSIYKVGSYKKCHIAINYNCFL